MRWDGDRESGNVEDRRGGGGGLPFQIGGLGAIVILVGGLLLGIDPGTLFSLLNGEQPSQQTQNQPGHGEGYGSSRPPQPERQPDRDDSV